MCVDVKQHSADIRCSSDSGGVVGYCGSVYVAFQTPGQLYVLCQPPEIHYIVSPIQVSGSKMESKAAHVFCIYYSGLTYYYTPKFS